MSTLTQGHRGSNSAVRRPALFLSPNSASTGGGGGGIRILPPSISPTLSRFNTSAGGNGFTFSEVRLAVLGSLGVGKSALVVKYITRRFIMEYDPLLEDVYTKKELLGSRRINVKIMDTSDTADKKPERYLKWANGFLVVFAVVCRASFEQAAIYLDTVNKYQRISAKDAPLVLVGNKVDLERYRTVGQSEAEALASRFDCAYLETSAAEDLDSVTDAFGRILSDIIRQRVRQPSSLQSLFISEDRHKTSPKAMSGHETAASTAVAGAPLEKKDDVKVQSTAPSPRRTTSGFKLFNKGFRIFN